ncbi:MAG: translesion DNA synthesis-associated protein ImuA [Ramlibacter sp.]
MQSPADLAIPHIWRVTDLAHEASVVSSGHAVLDAQLPGGGWPVGSLIEVLQHSPEMHAWQLLLPSLALWIIGKPGPIVLVGAPLLPYTPSLAAQGLPAERLLWIRVDAAAARLWSAEQALRCADVAALLAWLPHCKSSDLRRLQLATRQHGKLLFVFRPAQVRSQASPSPLRVLVEGADQLQLQVLKRKGPPLDHALQLPAHPPRLQALLASRRRGAVPLHVPTEERRSHVLDRLVHAP